MTKNKKEKRKEKDVKRGGCEQLKSQDDISTFWWLVGLNLEDGIYQSIHEKRKKKKMYLTMAAVDRSQKETRWPREPTCS